MRQPLEKYLLTDGYGPRGPIADQSGFHTGQDYAAPAGTPILAIHSGVVLRKWWDTFISTGAGAGGWMVSIADDDGYESRYAHMQAASPLKVGQRVTEGQEVGKVGRTGAAVGNHLHLEIWKNGQHLDPLKVIETIQQNPQSEEEEMKYFMMHATDPDTNKREFAVFSPETGFFQQFRMQDMADAWKVQIGPGKSFPTTWKFFNQICEDMKARRNAKVK